MRKLLAYLVLLPLTAGAQPITPGFQLPRTENMRLETADQREAKFLFDEGRRLHREGQVQRAVDLYRKALEKDPARLEYRPYLAQALQSTGQSEDALEQYALYLAREPEDLAVQRERLLPLISLGRWEELDREFAALDQPLANDPDYLQDKALSWLKRGQPEKAQSLLQTALKLAPERPDIRLNLASAYLLQAQGAPALELLQNTAGAELQRGLALYYLGRPAEAEAEWRKLVSTADTVEAGLNLATSLAQRGQDREALLLTAEMLDRQPQHQAGRLLYARLLNRAERYEEAWAVLRPLLTRTEEESFQGPRGYFLELVGWTLLGLQRDDEALGYLRQAVRLGQGGPAIEHNLALVLTRMGETKEALEHQLRATELAPQKADAWYQLGLLYEKRAQPAPALKAYRRFLELAPNDDLAPAVKERIARLKP